MGCDPIFRSRNGTARGEKTLLQVGQRQYIVTYRTLDGVMRGVMGGVRSECRCRGWGCSGEEGREGIMQVS